MNDDASWEMRRAMIEEEQKREEQELEERRKNNDFVQLYRSNMKHLRTLMREDMSAAEVFMFLTEHMGRNNALICSYRILEEALGFSKSTIYRSIKTLKDKRFIEVSRVGTANVYHLNADLVWSSWSTGKRFAALRGKILIAESEQEEMQAQTSNDLIPIISMKEQDQSDQ
ncbi:MAG: replication/maintenance protein RepL [Bacteroidota bacterium]